MGHWAISVFCPFFILICEPAFRRQEKQLLAGTRWLDKAIIATGGGMLANSDNMKNAKSLGAVVWLQTSEKSVQSCRLNTANRPLLQHSKLSVSDLYRQRKSIYMQSTLSLREKQRPAFRQLIKLLK